MQSVGQMAVVPVLEEGGGDSPFAPPDLEASTSTYGTLHVRNRADRPTIVPPGAAWVTSQRAQDHTTGGGALVKAGERRTIDTASCIEESQGGMISGANELLILPAGLRAEALAQRNQSGYNKLWPAIRRFNDDFGISQRGGHLVYFLQQFEKELDEFVAEFERVPRQVGAIIMIAGRVVGIERAPSEAFWEKLWVPLVRVCYGSLALKVARSGAGLPATRTPLSVTVRSLEGVQRALEQASQAAKALVSTTVEALSGKLLQAAPADEQLASCNLVTLASQDFAGQVVQQDTGQTLYASICAAAA
jgi:hypothetical protein